MQLSNSFCADISSPLARSLLNARAAINCNQDAMRGVISNVMNKRETGPSNRQLSMSAKRQLPTKFRKETRFDVCPIISAPFRGPVESRLEHLKHTLLQPVLRGTRNPELHSKLTWAAQEAASLAWLTPFPLLVFPGLFEEKLTGARKYWLKQQKIRGRGQPIALAA
jgi:hypothetical protein